MADAAAARRLALALPGVSDKSKETSVALYVGRRFFAWSWPERVGKGPRVPRLDVLALSCAPEAKDTILEADPDKFFTTSHYDGYPVVLLRLEAVDEPELLAILTSAWRCVARPDLVAELEQAQAGVS